MKRARIQTSKRIGYRTDMSQENMVEFCSGYHSVSELQGLSRRELDKKVDEVIKEHEHERLYNPHDMDIYWSEE